MKKFDNFYLSNQRKAFAFLGPENLHFRGFGGNLR